MVPPLTPTVPVSIADGEARRIALLLPPTPALRSFVETGAINDVLLRAVDDAAVALNLDRDAPPQCAAGALVAYVQEHGPRAAPERWPR